MPKSHKRGGQKAHNKRIKRRNELLVGERRKIQENFKQSLLELQQKFSAMTENVETVTENDETETEQVVEQQS